MDKSLLEIVRNGLSLPPSETAVLNALPKLIECDFPDSILSKFKYALANSISIVQLENKPRQVTEIEFNCAVDGLYNEDKRLKARKSVKDIADKLRSTPDNAELQEQIKDEFFKLNAGKQSSRVDLAKFAYEWREEKQGRKPVEQVYDVEEQGFKEERLYFEKGNITILAGRPSNGKTSYALYLCRCMAKHKPAFVSLEMSASAIWRKIISGWINNIKNISTWKLNPFEQQDNTEIDDIYSVAKDLDQVVELHCFERFFIPDLENVKSDVIFIDYLSLITATVEGQTVNYTYENILKELKEFAKKKGKTIILLCQLNRKGEESPYGEWFTMNMLRDSGAIEQYADNIFFVRRDLQNVRQLQDGMIECEIQIVKRREGEAHRRFKYTTDMQYERFYYLSVGE